MLWVFGYGSLIWKPPEGFQHARACPGGVKGFARRLWQGSTDHRGLPKAPGLVATLIRASELPKGEQDDDELCWGMCYGYPAEMREEVLSYLDYREKDGYDQCFVDVYLQTQDDVDDLARFAGSKPDLHGVVLYVAQTNNPQYLGPLRNEQVAQQIASAVGPSGTNREYLLKIADGLRRIRVHDNHVFDVEERVRALPEVQVSRVTAFEGDGTHVGDGGWMLQRLWDLGQNTQSVTQSTQRDLGEGRQGARDDGGGHASQLSRWTPLLRDEEAHIGLVPPAPLEGVGGPSGGCYSALSALSASEVLDKIGWPKSMAVSSIRIPAGEATDPNSGASEAQEVEIAGPGPDGDVGTDLGTSAAEAAVVARFPCGGGLVTVTNGPASFRHFLLTQSAVLRLPKPQGVLNPKP
jgi:cation transport protein ChaC